MPDETLNQLQIQYNLLCKSTRHAIQGDKDEIIRIATILRTLCYTNKRTNKGLLMQINPNFQIIDTLEDPFSIHTPLQTKDGYQSFPQFLGGAMSISPSKSGMYTLNRRATPRMLGIDDWWQRILFIESNEKITCCYLVKNIADSDGGAHVDPNLDENYYALSRKGSIAFEMAVNGTPYVPPSPAAIIIPHIALETVYSIKKAYPERCADYGLPGPYVKK